MARRYKKRSRKTRTYRKKQSGGMSIADMATAGFNMAKKIVRLINVEKKHYTQDVTEQANYSPSIIDLCDPLQGHDQDERTGDSIKPLHLTVRGFIQADTTQGSHEYVRIIVFRYKDEGGAAVTGDDILATTGSALVINSPKKWDKRFHSKILYDKVFTIGYSPTGATNANVPETRRFVISKKLFGHINWQDSTSTQEGGGLYMLVTSSNGTDANSPSVTFTSRVVYTDN